MIIKSFLATILLPCIPSKKLTAGKIQAIYCDPPYNTGKDSFGYNDRFNHSTWLTFFKNRMEVCRDLLSSQG